MRSILNTFSRCLLVVTATTAQAFSAPTTHTHDSPVTPFKWSQAESSPKLVFHKCYDGIFECAKLLVPLDWSDLSNPNNVSIAIVRLPAVVDRADKSYGGAILVNPGGPGGSGTDILLSSGRSLQDLVDGEKHFDVLSFDPRGMKYTTPNVACFHNDISRQSLEILGIGVGGLDGSSDALNVKWAIDQGLGQLCAQSGYFADGSNIRQFVSTALVARDMVEMIDRLDENLKVELNNKNPLIFNEQQQELSESSDDNVPLLNYWGLSYGSFLGNTFASMFPERVGRVILDGVVDADDYVATGWTTNLQDNDKAWSKFFEYCFEAGPKCSLYNPLYKSPHDLQAHVDAFWERLKQDPMPVIVGGNAGLLTHHILRTLLHTALYFPHRFWPIMAVFIDALDRGDSAMANSIIDGGLLWQNQRPQGFSPSLPPLPNLPAYFSMYATDSDLSSQPDGYAWGLEASIAVLCGDGDDITDRTKANHTDYLALLESQSGLSAPVWAEIILHCIHWPKEVRPASKNRFTGPFGSKRSDYNPKGSPILFIGNTADPVTPLGNAHKMSKGHEGSVVFTQDLPGHCSTSDNPSTCLFAVVRAFFANGTLPPKDLVCEGVRKPWDAI